MLIGMVVDTSGLIPKADSLVFDSLGKNINKLFANPVCEVKNSHKKLIEISLNTPQQISRVVIQENIANGKNVRKYVICAWLKKRWKVVAEGESIGHKRIQIFTPVITNKIRFSVKEVVGNLSLKCLAFYKESH